MKKAKSSNPNEREPAILYGRGQITAAVKVERAELASVHEVLGSDLDPSKRLLYAAAKL